MGTVKTTWVVKGRGCEDLLNTVLVCLVVCIGIFDFFGESKTLSYLFFMFSVELGGGFFTTQD